MNNERLKEIFESGFSRFKLFELKLKKVELIY